MAHHPASTNTMIPDVAALRVPSPGGASYSSADDVSAKTAPALASDASQGEGTRRAETSSTMNKQAQTIDKTMNQQAKTIDKSMKKTSQNRRQNHVVWFPMCSL